MSQGARATIWRYLPYLVAFVALGWVFRQTDLHHLKDALSRAPLVSFVIVSAVLLLANCAADVFAMSQVFSWFGFPVPYWELYIVRASTYLLAVVNYHVGQAAIVGYLYRARKVPLLRATSAIVFIIGINVGTLFLLASLGASRATGDLQILTLIPFVCIIGVIVYATLLWLKPPIIAKRTLFAPLFEMGIIGHCKGVLVRLPHVGVLCLWHYISLQMFDIRISPTAALLYLPAYFAVSSLPINVQGIGAAQLVAIRFFSPFAVGVGGAALNPAGQRAVIAYSLSTAGISTVLQMLLGVVCLRQATKLGMKQVIEEAERGDSLVPQPPDSLPDSPTD